MGISFSEYKRRAIKSGKNVTVTTGRKGGDTKTTTKYSGGKKVSSSKNSSSSSRKSKKTVVYDASGKVMQSNDPSKPVGSVDTTKVIESGLSKSPDYRGKSVVYERKGNVITEKVFSKGGKVSTRVLDTNQTTSQLAKQLTGIRRAQESKAFRDAEKKVLSGTANAKDLINYASFGKGKVSNILANKNLNQYVRSQVEYDNFKREVAKNLTPKQKEHYNELDSTEQGNYLFQVASRRVQPAQEKLGLTNLSEQQQDFYKKLSPKSSQEYLRQISRRKKPSNQISLNLNQSSLYKSLSTKEKINYVKQVVDRSTLKKYDPKKGYAIVVSIDPFTGKETLVDSSGNITRYDANKFVNSVNDKTRKELATTINSYSQSVKNLFSLKSLSPSNIGKELHNIFKIADKELQKIKNISSLTNTQRKAIAIFETIPLQFALLGTSALAIKPFIKENIEALKIVLTSIAGSTVRGASKLLVDAETFENIKKAYPNTIKGSAEMMALSARENPASFWGSLVANIFLFNALGIGAGKVGLSVSNGVTKVTPLVAKSRMFKNILKNTKSVSKIPRTTKAYPKGTILTSKSGAGIVLNNGRVLNLSKASATAIERGLLYGLDLTDSIFDATFFLGKSLGTKVITAINKSGIPALTGNSLKASKYVSRLSKNNPILGKISKNILDTGAVLRRYTPKTLSGFDFSFLSKNPRLINALKKTLIKTKAQIFGSLIEFQAKAEMLQKFYLLTDGESLSFKQAISKYKSDLKTKGTPLEVIDAIVGNPKDLDLVIPNNKILRDMTLRFAKAFRDTPELLRDYIKKTTGYKIDLNDMKTLRNDPGNVLSVLSLKQVDDLLRSFTESPAPAMFKLDFLQNLYDSKAINKKAFKDFDLSGSGLQNTKLDFKLDVHDIKEVATSKKVFGFFNKKTKLPIESQSEVNFESEISKNRLVTHYLTKQKTKYLYKLANKINKQLQSRYGLIKNKDKFTKLYVDFLDKSGIRNVKTFDFAQNDIRTDFNKNILKTYKAGLDFADSITISTKAKGFDFKTPAKFVENALRKKTKGLKTYDMGAERFLLDYLLRTSKKASKKLNDLDTELDFLKQSKENLVYLSERAQKGTKGKIKLKGFISEKDGLKLVEKLEGYDKNIQKLYSDKALDEMLSNLPEGTKAISTIRVPLDLGKTFKRITEEIKKLDTDKVKFIKTKGKKTFSYRTPLEQLNRRLAGALSRIFESRRAKDIKKLYGNAIVTQTLLEGYINKLNSIKNPFKRAKLERQIGTNLKKLTKDLKQLKSKTKKMNSQVDRLEIAYRTKGKSETTEFRRFEDATTTKTQQMVQNLARKEVKKLDSPITKKKHLELETKITKIARKQGFKDLQTKVKKVDIKTKSAFSKAVRKYVRSALKSVLRKSTSKSTSKSRSKSTSKSGSKSRSRSRSISKSPSKSRSKSTSKSGSKSRSRSRSTSKSTSKSRSKSTSKSGSKSRSRSRSISKSTSKSASKSKSPSKPPVLPPLPKLTWNTKLPKGINLIVNARYKKGNKIFIKRLNTTPNRARKIMNKFVDNNLVRSYDLVIVGKKKVKDIKKPSMVKFRARQGKDPKVRVIVEKSKYTLDTRGEKRALSRARVIKRRKTKAKASKKSKVRKRTSKARSKRKRK
jgi:hypothetical protein